MCSYKAKVFHEFNGHQRNRGSRHSLFMSTLTALTFGPTISLYNFTNCCRETKGYLSRLASQQQLFCSPSFSFRSSTTDSLPPSTSSSFPPPPQYSSLHLRPCIVYLCPRSSMNEVSSGISNSLSCHAESWIDVVSQLSEPIRFLRTVNSISTSDPRCFLTNGMINFQKS